MTGTETGVEAEAGYLGLQVISRWTAEGAEGAAGKGRWEEAHGVVEFDRARIAGNSNGQQERWFEALSARIERGQHTLVVGGSKQRRAALGAVLAGPDSCGLLVGGRVRSPRAHSGVARVAGGRRPYVRGGSSLWDLLVFPHDKAQSLRRGVEERHLAELLRCLEFGFLLAHVGSDWGKVIDWAKVLDRRGCAALAVCRVLYHAPEFAVIDDEALRELLPDQVRRVVAVANRHRTTIVVLAEADPFDDSPPLSPPQSAASSVSLRGTGSSSGSGDDAGFYACIGEFSRALRLRGARVWEFCSFGYGSAQRAAFDVAAARKWVWAADSDDGGQGFRSTLRRMPSTLSQCTTTERHWLVTPEYPLSPAGADRSGSSLSRRQSALLASPALTARSSLSDIAAAGPSELGSIRLRMAATVADSAPPAPPPRQPSPPPPREPSPPPAVESIAEQGEDADDHVQPAAAAAAPPPLPAPIAFPLLVPAPVAVRGGPRVISEEELEAGRPTTPTSPRPRNYRRSTRAGLSFIPVPVSRPPSRPFSRADESPSAQTARGTDMAPDATVDDPTRHTPDDMPTSRHRSCQPTSQSRVAASRIPRASSSRALLLGTTIAASAMPAPVDELAAALEGL